MMLRYSTLFNVQGSGEFPYTMLGYDNCFPYSANDAANISSKQVSGLREVWLVTCHESKECDQITPARWASFGWRVAEKCVPTKL